MSGTASGTDGGKNNSSSKYFLTSAAPFLSVRIYILIGAVSLCVILLSLLIFLCVRLKRASRKRNAMRVAVELSSGSIPLVSKEIVEIKGLDRGGRNGGEEVKIRTLRSSLIKEEASSVGSGVLVVDFDLEAGERKKSGGGGSDDMSLRGSGDVSVEAQNIGWGRWYSLKELEIATRGFSDENIIGEGGYGVVYRGVLQDGSVVAVKNLLNNKGQAEKEFKVEVEAIGKVRHKNLVRLIGYCAEGTRSMLVYEYIDNGNLEQWLHGDVGPVSPLTWEIRMKIAIGTAKGLAYLHEGLDPKVVHRDVKSSNILLDKKWNPKVSDFGLAKLLGSEASYVTTRVMGTFGYVSPDYASTGMLNEGSDVYSFGVLLMEMITGRSPIDYSRPAGEMNLVDWFKGMVASHRGEELVDPLIENQPPSRALKRTLLVCLRCIDLDSNKRPKMGQIVHMLDTDDFPYRAELRPIPEKNPSSRRAAVSTRDGPRLAKHYDDGDDAERLRRR